MAAAMRCYRHPDRETYISCSECGRPICTECMTPAPVGQRCPEHSGKPQGVARVATGIRRAGYEGSGGLVTRILIGVNVGVYLLELATGGASGALFGILGAALVLERQRTYVLGGSALGLIVINLVFSFTFSGISIGGHIGGLIGGAACMLVLSRFGRGHGAYGRVGAAGVLGVLEVGVISVGV